MCSSLKGLHRGRYVCRCAYIYTHTYPGVAHRPAGPLKVFPDHPPCRWRSPPPVFPRLTDNWRGARTSHPPRFAPPPRLRPTPQARRPRPVPPASHQLAPPPPGPVAAGASPLRGHRILPGARSLRPPRTAQFTAAGALPLPHLPSLPACLPIHLPIYCLSTY